MPRPPLRAVLLVPVLVAALAVPTATAGASERHRPPPGSPSADVVVEWDAAGVAAIAEAGVAAGAPLTPDVGHLILAYTSIAVYDATMAVQRTHEPFAVDLDAPEGASVEAAAAAAAHGVLVHHLPAAESVAVLDAALATTLARIADGDAENAGVALGEEVAAQLIALRQDDGFRSTDHPYVVPADPQPGQWIPTAPTPPLGTYLPHMDPFTLSSADQFRPDGPPRLTGRRYAREYAEVKALGSDVSTRRTDEQTVAAQFWGEPPVPQARGAFRKFVTDRGLDLYDASRFLAMMSVTYADAFIACFDAKYHYAFWRPVTAIHAGDDDGNRRTRGDTSWTPLLPTTPNHPDYPSAHSCITPATGVVISRFLDTSRIRYTVPSLTGLGDRTFRTTKRLTREVLNARVWGGIHFRSAVEDGADIARSTADHVLTHHFGPASGQ